MLSKADGELLTRVGPGTAMGALFRRFWLPALLPDELPGPDCAPLRIRLLGENLVAFRDTNGSVGFIAESCPHRGASLFFGRNEEAGLRCVYHGWKFDTAGNCTDMPNEPAESSFKHKIKATAYPAREYGGLIWVYMGPPAVTPDLPELEWAMLPADQRYVRKIFLDANFAQAQEGEIDNSHTSFLHRWFNAGDLPNQRSFLSSAIWNDGAPQLRVRDTDCGFCYGARRGLGQGQYHWRVTQWLLPNYSLLPGRDGLYFGHVWVPIDDEHTWNYYYSYNVRRSLTPDEVAYFESGATGKPRLIAGTFMPVANQHNDYTIDRAMQRTKNYTGIWSSGEQDLAVMESMGHIYDRTREHLGTADSAVIRARSILLRLAKQLQAGVEPFAPHHPTGYRVRPIDKETPHEDFAGLMAEFHAEAVVP